MFHQLQVYILLSCYGLTRNFPTFDLSQKKNECLSTFYSLTRNSFGIYRKKISRQITGVQKFKIQRGFGSIVVK